MQMEGIIRNYYFVFADNEIGHKLGLAETKWLVSQIIRPFDSAAAIVSLRTGRSMVRTVPCLMAPIHYVLRESYDSA